MCSAGWLGHQPTTFVLIPFCVRIFHSAFTFLEVLSDARTLIVFGSGSTKPRMPCLSPSLPVAIDVHSIGDKGGSNVARFPITPLFTSDSSVGISPWSISRLITFQSAASQPMSKTFLALLLLICFFLFEFFRL